MLIKEDRDVQLTLKQFAKKFDVPEDTLRHYDRMGILVPARKENGYRVYGYMENVKMYYILNMKYTNFSLSEIKLVMNMFKNGDCKGTTKLDWNCFQTVEGLLKKKIAEHYQVIEHYKTNIAIFEELLPIIQKDMNIENLEVLESKICAIYHEIYMDSIVKQ